MPDLLLSAAEELYALPAGDFVAARKARAASAKTDGDGELARRIGGLRKPSAAAWVVNQLVRHRAEEMSQLLDLGESLRRAQADLDAAAMRELGRQRRQVTLAMSRQGVALARELDASVSDTVLRQVEETLHAAMVDAGAAAAVRSGLLARPLSPAGLGSLDAGSVVADASALGHVPGRGTAAPTLTVVPDDTLAREAAEQALASAVEAAAKVRRKSTKAAARVERTEARLLELQAQLDEVRRRAAELEHALDGTADELDAAREKSEALLDRAALADEEEQQAREVLEELGS